MGLAERAGKKDTSSKESQKRTGHNASIVSTSSSINTFLDQVYQKVQEKDGISIGKIGRSLRVGVTTAESWAKLLERQGLVEIHFPPFGPATVHLTKANKQGETRLENSEELEEKDEKEKSDSKENKKNKKKKRRLGKSIFKKGFVLLIIVIVGIISYRIIWQ